MQKKTRIWLAGGAVSLAAIAGIATLAHADMDGGMGGGWGHHMRGMMGHGMGGGGQMMMERYDANKDGKLTQDEIDQNRAQWLAEFDAGKNGTLSLDEFKNLWLKARNEEMVREFQFFDRDGNGQVTGDEYKAPLADLVANRDRNGDGALSKDDRPQRGEGRGDHMRRHMGQGMDQGDGQGMMDGDQGDDADNAPPPPPPAPAKH